MHERKKAGTNGRRQWLDETEPTDTCDIIILPPTITLLFYILQLGRDAKCHGYDGLIRVKILASWGKSLGEHTILKNEAFFGGELHNLCEMSLSKLS